MDLRVFVDDSRHMTYPEFNFLGVHYRKTVADASARPIIASRTLEVSLTLNLWTALLIAALPCLSYAALRLIKTIRHRRREAQRASRLCSVCSYDLRAHHPGNLCPECGTLVPSPAPETAA